MFKNLTTLLLMVLTINFNLSAEIDFSKIFNSKKFIESQVTGTIPVKLSPMTCKLINTLKDFDYKSEKFLSSKKSKDFVLKQIDNTIYVGGLIKVNDDFDIQTLSNYGIKIGTRAGSILSFNIPIMKLEELFKIPGIDYIQIDEKVSPKLNKVRSEIGSEMVNAGTGLPRAYKGTNVIVGIVDGGFDYTHINFLREDGSEYRILSVWDQSAEGTAPEGFSYGNELSTPNMFLNEQTDSPYLSHGTHVAGIAAGSGYNTDGDWKGVAPDANLVFVSLGNQEKERYSTGQSEILDGINYVFKQAEKLGKPAVINMSLGTHIGPHDGTSLFDEACDALVGEGKIIVGAAGNEGEIPLHLSHTFSPTDNQFNTGMYIEDDQPGRGRGIADIWGDTGKNFQLVISLLKLQTEEMISTDIISTSQNLNNSINLIGSDNQECEVNVFTTSSDFNGKPRIFLEVTTYSEDLVILSFQQTEGKIHLWNHATGNGAPFYSLGNGSKEGDVNSTVGEIGGTGKNIITVGAYCTKNSYSNLNSYLIENSYKVDTLTPFSSLGPTSDGRIKPEITAPGSFVISSVNSFDFFMSKGFSDYYLADESTIDGSYYWYFAGFEGTSMSSPVVAGAIALMLEHKPDLTPSAIKNILKATAKKDSFTGTIPTGADNSWGFGKLDCFAAVDYTITSVTEFSQNEPDIIMLYPNPCVAHFFVSTNHNYEKAELIITDLLGNIIFKDDNYEQFELVNTEHLTNNIYFVKLLLNNKVYTKKLILNK